MTYAADIATLRAPVLDQQASYPPIYWETEPEDPSSLATAKQASPGEYMLFRHEYASGEYGASGGGNQVYKFADVDWRIAAEASAGGRFDAIAMAYADLLVSHYVAASDGQTTFRTPEAYLTSVYEPHPGWLARDWVCPVWIHAAA